MGDQPLPATLGCPVPVVIRKQTCSPIAVPAVADDLKSILSVKNVGVVLVESLLSPLAT